MFNVIYKNPFPFTPEYMPLWTVVAFVVGACMGSFLNVCIWRIPNDESVIFPDSHCPKCNHKLYGYENIPFFSWIFLRGRCSSCHEPISIRYILVELLTACLFTAAWVRLLARHEPVYFFLPYMVMIMLIISASFIDVEHRIIPDELTYTAMGFGLIYAFLFPRYWVIPGTVRHDILNVIGPYVDPDRITALCRAVAALLTGLVCFGLFAYFGKLIFRKEALGGGDVKYLGSVGACLGFLGCFYTVFFGALFGTVIGLAIVLFKKDKENTIPFGPYLAAGSLIWILYGPNSFMWFLNFAEMVKN